MRHALRGGSVQVNTEQHRIAGYLAGPVPPKPIEVPARAIRGAGDRVGIVA